MERERVMGLYADVKATGGYISNHESDLYIEVNECNTALLKKYGLKARVFKNQVTDKFCYDVPFAFVPFWERVQAESERRESLKQKES